MVESLDLSEPLLRLVVGLGNPGPRYQHSRHNAGFWLVDELARHYSGHFRSDSRFSAEVCQIDLSGQGIWLFKPMTFMNRSGQSVERFVDYYKIPLATMLVAHDDLDLPPGTVRLKRGGGHGGHNGLRDTIYHLGDVGFMRLRLGIGHPGNKEEVVDYVLCRPTPNEQMLIERAVNDVVGVFPQLVAGRLQKAIHALHSRQIEA
jgi:PTH1 family peptidyl-tRNA hydrolase